MPVAGQPIPITTEPYGSNTVERLARPDPGGNRVLTMYVDLDSAGLVKSRNPSVR